MAAQLRAHRLVTLTGPGGVGKTRLALQAAADALERYPDGVWLAELGALADPALVPQAVAAAVGVREEPDRPLLATLTAALRPKRLLLVLDNCEHLLDACARLAEALLRAGPGVRVLATSRAPLGAAGEALSPVPPLGLPPAGDGAPGRRGRPPRPRRGSPRRGGAPLRRAGGGRAPRLRGDGGDRGRRGPDLPPPGRPPPGDRAGRRPGAGPGRGRRGRPAGGPLPAADRREPGGAPPAADAAGGGGLEPRPARRAGAGPVRPPLGLRRGLLAGGRRGGGRRGGGPAGRPPGPGDAGDPAAAGPAGPAVLGLLLGLVDQSLVVAEPLPDGTTRFRLLETLRQYAREALEAGGGAEAARARHAAHYLAAVEAADAPRLGPAPAAAAPLWVPEQAAVWRRLGAARDDLRAALGWLLERGDGAAGLRLALALAPFWREFSQREGERWLEALLARRAGAPAALRAGATAAAGHLAAWRGDHARARALFEAAVALAREQGDRRLLAAALGGLGQAVGAAGGPPGRAAALLEEGLALHRELGDERGGAGALYALGMLAHFRGEPARAVALVEEGLARSRRLGLGAGLIDLGLFHLGLLAYLQGQPDRAEGLARQALARRRDLAQAVGRPWACPGAWACASRCWPAWPARRAGPGGRRGCSARPSTAPGPQGRRSSYPGTATTTTARWPRRAPRLGEDAFAAAWAAGRAMAPEDAVAYALADAPDAA